MNKIIDIGSAPLFRGEYNAKSVYYNDNVVTMCGCVFIGLVNEISGIPPLTKQSNGTLVSHPSWVCGLKLYLSSWRNIFSCHTLRGCVD